MFIWKKTPWGVSFPLDKRKKPVTRVRVPVGALEHKIDMHKSHFDKISMQQKRIEQGT
jgi:hypothetical protein